VKQSLNVPDSPSLAAILVPGYGGGEDQPILRSLGRALAEHNIPSRPLAFSTRGRRPSAGYAVELAELRAARDALQAETGAPVALVGRSFGGRMCAFLAALEPPPALVLLGHPISPPKRPRPDDETALAALACPTFIVQGDRDELGPLDVLQRIASGNRNVEISVLEGAAHSFGRHEREAVARAVDWLGAQPRSGLND